MVAMATTLFTVYCKLFHMMPYIIILKVRKFHQPTANRFSTARKKPVGPPIVPPPPSLNKVNSVRASVERQILASQKEALAMSKYSIRVHIRDTGPKSKPINIIVPTTLATNLAVGNSQD